MKIKSEFRLNGKPIWYSGPPGPNGRRGVREELLLATGSAGVENALVDIVESVKPPGTEVFVSRSFGPAPQFGGAVKGKGGRMVVWLFDQSEGNARSTTGRQAERRWKKSQLQQALARIGGKFLRRSGRSF